MTGFEMINFTAREVKILRVLQTRRNGMCKVGEKRKLLAVLEKLWTSIAGKVLTKSQAFEEGSSDAVFLDSLGQELCLYEFSGKNPSVQTTAVHFLQLGCALEQVKMAADHYMIRLNQKEQVAVDGVFDVYKTAAKTVDEQTKKLQVDKATAAQKSSEDLEANKSLYTKGEQELLRKSAPDPLKADPSTFLDCPGCGNKTAMKITSDSFVREENAKRDTAWAAKKAAAPIAKRAKMQRPTSMKTVSHFYACQARSFHCHGKQHGSCFECNKSGPQMQPRASQLGADECGCPVCNSTCTTVFDEAQHRKLMLAAAYTASSAKVTTPPTVAESLATIVRNAARPGDDARLKSDAAKAEQIARRISQAPVDEPEQLALRSEIRQPDGTARVGGVRVPFGSIGGHLGARNYNTDGRGYRNRLGDMPVAAKSVMPTPPVVDDPICQGCWWDARSCHCGVESLAREVGSELAPIVETSEQAQEATRQGHAWASPAAHVTFDRSPTAFPFKTPRPPQSATTPPALNRRRMRADTPMPRSDVPIGGVMSTLTPDEEDGIVLVGARKRPSVELIPTPPSYLATAVSAATPAECPDSPTTALHEIKVQARASLSSSRKLSQNERKRRFAEASSIIDTVNRKILRVGPEETPFDERRRLEAAVVKASAAVRGGNVSMAVWRLQLLTPGADATSPLVPEEEEITWGDELDWEDDWVDVCVDDADDDGDRGNSTQTELVPDDASEIDDDNTSINSMDLDIAQANLVTPPF